MGVTDILKFQFLFKVNNIYEIMCTISNLLITDISEIGDITYNISTLSYFINKVIPINISSDIPLHKFWVYIDKCKLLTKNDNKISAVLSVKSDSIKIINSIEQKISEKIKNEISELLTIKFSIDSTFVPTMLLEMNYQTIAFDNDDTKININDIKIQSDLNLIIELNYLIVTPNKIFPSWRIVQIRKTNFINVNESIFNRITKKVNTLDKQVPIPPPPPLPPLPPPLPSLPPPLPPSTTHQSIHQSQMKKFIPSVSDLSNALGNLKKISNVPKINELESSSSTHIPILKHVKTKEPKCITEILREEFVDAIKDDIHKFNEIKKNMNNAFFKKVRQLQELRDTEI